MCLCVCVNFIQLKKEKETYWEYKLYRVYDVSLEM